MADPRTILAHGGVAAARLEGLIAAERYAEVRPMRCAAPLTGLRRGPATEAELLNQLLFGERFDVLLTENGFAFGQAGRDGYVGWAPLADLAEPGAAPTHRIAAPLAWAFAGPDVRAPARGPYPMNALVALEAREGRLARAPNAGWFVESQLSPIGRFETADLAEIAGRLRGAPYLWGGRTLLGVDCSGLIQAALFAQGRACPRDSDQQAAELGQPIPAEAFGRNDLIFWRGHAAIGLGDGRVLHATSAVMGVLEEPLVDAIARTRETYGDPVGCRRL